MIFNNKPSECLRATERYKNFAPFFSLITSFLLLHNKIYRAKRRQLLAPWRAKRA